MPRLTTAAADAPTARSHRARLRSPRALVAAGAVALGASATLLVACGRGADGGRSTADTVAGFATSPASVDNDAAHKMKLEARRERVMSEQARAAVPAMAPAPPLAAAGFIGGAAGGAAPADAMGAGSSAQPSRADVDDIADRVVPEMVIRSGTATVQVDSIDLAVQRVRQLAQRVGGVIANSSLQGGRDQVRTATLEVKVAAARFDDLVTGLTPFGKVEAVDVTAQEVGEEYVDVSARVANARRLEARLIDLLATRTGKLSDVLTVERELSRVREEIERYEGRLRYLKSRSAVSTLAITVHEPMPLLAGQPSTNPIAEALRHAWRNFVALTAAVIASLGVLVPLAGVAVLGWAGYRRIRRQSAGVTA